MVVTGEEPARIKLADGMRFERGAMSMTHEEADTIMVQQAIKVAKSGVKSICALSDDTHVFILLIYFNYQENISFKLVIQATGNKRN